MDWIYNNSLFDAPGDNYGFVYLITNTITGRKYIGKKFFWAMKIKVTQCKGVKKKKRYKAESDWKNYWSSSEELQADIAKLGKENFTREIIRLCPSKGTTNYFEAKLQFQYEVLENPDLWYNGFIGCKIHRSHVKL